MPKIVLSQIYDAYLNLAIESWLFKHLRVPDKILFLYQNSRCIVIGRNQNPWLECNLGEAARQGYSIVRRRSGGGTVVHDFGNINFCVQTSRKEFSRDKHSLMILRALKSRGVDLRLNKRHDIVDSHSNKVSGSSFKIEREKAYHHATMLYDSDLSKMNALLTRDPKFGTIDSRGTESVRSPVANAPVNYEMFCEAWIDAFTSSYGQTDLVYITEEGISADIKEDASLLRSWEWVFGQTPAFTHKIGGQIFEVSRGVVKKGPENTVGKIYNATLPVPEEIRSAIDPVGFEKNNNLRPN